MAHGIHEFGKESLKLCCRMKENNIEPNASTFVSVLSSSSIVGLDEEDGIMEIRPPNERSMGSILR